jgi:hypothetical protein
MVGKAQKSHGARSELNSAFGLGKGDGETPSERPPYSPDLAPCDFWAYHEKGAPKQEISGDQQSAERFWEVGGTL